MASEQKERMQRGELYLPNDPEIRADRVRCQLLLERFNAISAADEETRMEVLRDVLGTLGKHATIWPPFRCDYGYNVHMEDGSFINYNAVILDAAPVHIGRDVQIGPNLQIMSRSTRWTRPLAARPGSSASHSPSRTTCGSQPVSSCCPA